VSRFVTAAGIIITLGAWAGMVVHGLSVMRLAGRQHEYLAATQAWVYVALASVLVYGSLVYLFSRWGHLTRLQSHRPPSEAELAAFQLQPVSAVTILVPSYKEDPGVVRKTLLSAALQDYPRRSVVLLLDDPPVPMTAQDAKALDEMRHMPADIERLLAPMRSRTARALTAFEATSDAASGPCLAAQTRDLAELLRETAEWFAEQARRHEIRDHSDHLFVELTFLLENRRFQQNAAQLMNRADAGSVDVSTLHAEYRRLARRFDVTLRSFERKRYANLSHEPNKAMNLNSYLGLMGGCFEEHREHGRLILRPAPPATARLAIPDSEYVLILDADSILHPEYTVRLAYRLGRPDHRRVAVIQTPYSAFPGAGSALERVAGATTDMQYQIHQGFTHYHATFWVGANAMVRMRALREIAQTRQERGFTIRTFIHDRTVIEDTESTVDLRHRGWQLHNYPERLAFSATPPDFGSLLIQRRRWANGGLLIVPKLWRSWSDGRQRMTIGEAVLRLHYLISLAASNVALLILLAWGFDDRLASAWLPITAVPYYVLFAADLRRAGYRGRDVLRVYALNMLLIPVSLGGVLCSLRQACTGKRSAFARTPKVTGRTAAPAGYIAAEATLFLSWLFGAGTELYFRHRLNAAFSLCNATFLLYAFLRFVGVRAACDDLAPLGQAVRQRWAAARRMWIAKTRRLATPAVIVLGLLLLPTAATGSEIAITVDDLPAHGPLPPGTDRESLVDAVIATLKRHGVAGAVGFVNGDQLSVESWRAAIIGRWLAAGYSIGNHTLSHVDLDRSDVATYLKDVELNEEVLSHYLGATAPKLFRYPYLHEGDTPAKRRAVRAGLHSRGYKITPATINFSDWIWNEAYVRCLTRGDSDALDVVKRKLLQDADAALDWSELTARGLIGRPIRHIVLLHLGAINAVALDDLLALYERRGARFIPVVQAMTDPIYGIDPGMTGRSNFLLQLLHATGRRADRLRSDQLAEIEATCR
jgi:cellulose synthase/poly-beta-1,6-N-acetylglucosamine synthase-like glycosyltransferase/peptidoglycan/xylan/chitin deacetylase (PgdA/CDA1 family)